MSYYARPVFSDIKSGKTQKANRSAHHLTVNSYKFMSLEGKPQFLQSFKIKLEGEGEEKRWEEEEVHFKTSNNDNNKNGRMLNGDNAVVGIASSKNDENFWNDKYNSYNDNDNNDSEKMQ